MTATVDLPRAYAVILAHLARQLDDLPATPLVDAATGGYRMGWDDGYAVGFQVAAADLYDQRLHAVARARVQTVLPYPVATERRELNMTSYRAAAQAHAERPEVAWPDDGPPLSRGATGGVVDPSLPPMPYYAPLRRGDHA